MPSDRLNNFWYCRRDPNFVIVFVHGIFSNSRTCWLHEGETNGEAVFWPDLVRQDDRLGAPSIYLGGYYTALDSYDFSIRDCARELLEALQQPSRDGAPPVLESDAILFVAHSTGGVVARYLLARHQDLFRNKAVGLLLIASPSLGSIWANVARLASWYYGQKLGAQLQWGGEALEEIHSLFRDLVDARNTLMPRLVGAEACENKMILRRNIPVFIRWAIPPRWKVVPTISAGQYFGSVKLLADTDHFTAVKPNGFNHPSHEFLVTFVRRFRKEASVSDNAPSNASESNQAALLYLSSSRISVLYDQLPSTAVTTPPSRTSAWLTTAALDTVGYHGTKETALRTAQRQLRIVLEHLHATGRIRDIGDLLNGEPEEGTFYRCVARFSMLDWMAGNKLLALGTTIEGHKVTLSCSKSNFPGITTSGDDRSYEPNSLRPQFFAGTTSLPLLAYLDCERVDRQARHIDAGALCLIANPSQSQLESLL